METFTLGLGRCWIARAMGRNPLVRGTDRLEALVLLIAFAVALVLVPVAGAIGTAVHDSRAQMLAEEARNRHEIAVVVVNVNIDDPAIHDVPVTAVVRWRVGDADRTAEVEADPALAVGDQMGIWVNAAGNPVSAPRPAWWAGIEGLAAGIALWVGVIAAFGGLVGLARVSLDHQRSRGWDREWQQLWEDSDGRTGSQP